MLTRRVAISSLGLVCLLSSFGFQASAAGSPPFTTWLNAMIDKVKAERIAATTGAARVAVSTRSNTNQAEAPSMSANTTSIVDTSSASDLIGVALNLASLAAGTNSSDTNEDKTSASATASSY